MKIKDFRNNKEAAINLIKEELSGVQMYWEDGAYYAHFQISGDEIVLADNYRDADFTVTSAISAEAMMAAAGINDPEVGVGDIASDFEDTPEFAEVCEDLYEEALKELEAYDE